MDLETNPPSLVKATLEIEKEIKLLEIKAAEIAERLQRARGLLASIRDYLSTPTEMKSNSSAKLTSFSIKKSPEAPRTNGELVVSVTRTLLQEAQKPLDRRQILDGLKGQGHELLVVNPPKFIGRTLWSHPDFIHVPHRGYWFSDIGVPTDEPAMDAR